MKPGSECYVLIYYYREGRNEIIWNEFSLPKDYTKKLRDDDICSKVECILYRMKT